MALNTKQIIKGTAWMSASTIVVALFQLLSLVVLTRFLSKSEFGIVAIVTMVLGIVHTLSDLGFSTIIMYKKDLTEDEFSSLYWLQFGLFLLMYFIMVLLSPFIAAFYNEPSLSYLIPISLFALVFMGVGMLYNTMLQKNKEFKIIALRNIIASLSSFIFAVVLAMLGFGVLSLILSTLFQTAVLHLWNFISGVKIIKVKRCVKYKQVKPLIKIGLYQTGTQLVDYISSKLDILIIGKILGSELLGVYNLAKELIIKIVSLLNSIANKVALPYFTEMQEDKKKLSAYYCSFISKLSLLNFPLCMAIGGMSPFLIQCLYGELYADVIPVLTILAIWGMLVAVGNPINNIIVSIGRTDISFKFVIVRLLITLPIIALASTQGLVLTAFATLGCEFIMLFISWFMELWLTLRMKLYNFYSVFFSNFLLSIVVIFSVYYMSIYWMHETDKYLGLLQSFFLTLVVYIGLFFTFRRKSLFELFNIVSIIYKNLCR